MTYQVSQVGCPIRKSSDQRVFAPPRRLSQRITSFIACACQGIHQLPLRHLIILIANAHRPEDQCAWQKRPASRDLSDGAVRQPIICQGLSVPRRRTAQASLAELEQIFSSRCHAEQAESRSLPQTLMCERLSPTREWWSRTGSNRRHPACKAGALPAELRPLFPGLKRRRPHPWPWLTRHQARSSGQAQGQAGRSALRMLSHPGRPTSKTRCHQKWWAWEDLNLRPHAYQARALTN